MRNASGGGNIRPTIVPSARRSSVARRWVPVDEPDIGRSRRRVPWPPLHCPPNGGARRSACPLDPEPWVRSINADVATLYGDIEVRAERLVQRVDVPERRGQRLRDGAPCAFGLDMYPSRTCRSAQLLDDGVVLGRQRVDPAEIVQLARLCKAFGEVEEA